MMRVLFSEAAREAPRLTVVVVFPTPPFWLAIAITLDKSPPQEKRNVSEGAGARQHLFHVKRWTNVLANHSESAFHVKQAISRGNMSRAGLERLSVSRETSASDLAALWDISARKPDSRTNHRCKLFRVSGLSAKEKFHVKHCLADGPTDQYKTGPRSGDLHGVLPRPTAVFRYFFGF
jgi:hypothetical protein